MLPKSNHRVVGMLLKEEISRARKIWIKFAQNDLQEELDRSIKSDEKSKIHGRFKRLAPFKDHDEVWRVGSRVREYTPFTEDHLPPALLPRNHRLTFLLMREAHERRHSGVSDTVGQFRIAGYWTPKANILAKKIKESCVICKYLDKQPLHQVMGSIPGERLVNPVAWGQVELDLFGPMLCKSDVNKRSSKKVWGILIVDVNSGAIHIDTVLDYSAEEVIKALRRFASLRGWPNKISSDPGSQLQNASENMSSWWSQFQGDMVQHANTQGFSWDIRPADSQWRQGKSEVSIKLVKRFLKVAIGDVKLTPSELQTALFEVANLCNERPIGVNKSPLADGTYKVLTPNCLLIGRSVNSVPDDSDMTANMKKADRYLLIQQVTHDFWDRWSSEVTPMYLVRQRWHDIGRDLSVGDVVLVHDASAIKGDYKLAVVDSVNVSKDGKVRSCKVSYSIPNSKDSVKEYSGVRRIQISRSVQRLTLLLPVEDQSQELVVNGAQIIQKNHS